jgi:Rps23 Pro-64 3,4-dihydroxylase Tpa1-like proline 4-hydroxylase
MPSSDPPVSFGPSLDVARIAGLYARHGRVHIGSFLSPDSAARAHRCLACEVPWQLHFNDGARTYDLVQQQLDVLPEAGQVLIHRKVNDNAVHNFQYLFNNFPLWDAYEAGQHRELYVMRVLEFLNSAQFLEFGRRVTGVDSIALVDGQATLYRPGHFLTVHDDAIVDKRRIAAYVLSLTPQWRADWGGILNFLDEDGHVAEGYTPSFNALNLFRVPQRHAVSFVAPFAREERLSISGWLRAAT